MRKLKIGMLGTLHDHSVGKLDCVRKFPDIFEIVGIVPDSDERIAGYRAAGFNNFTFWTSAELKAHPSFRDYPLLTEEQLMNAGCDFIMVEGFEYDLPFAAMRCVENGIPVHIDKPVGRDIKAFTDLLRLAKKKELPLQVAYMYRYNEAVLDCLRMVKSGELGEILSCTAQMNIEHPAEKRHWHGMFDYGNMFYIGCHMLDLIHLMQGMPRRITPYITSSGLDGNTSFDQGTAILEYPRGISIAQSNGTEINGYQHRQLVVSGSKGTYEIRPLEMKPSAIISRQGKGGEIKEFPLPSGRYDSMMLDFAAIVLGEKENPFDYGFELDTHRMALAACGYDVDYTSEIGL